MEGWYQPETTIKYWDGRQETIGVTISYKVEDGSLEDTLVDPSTIGQYTGLTDKNGKRIFEGDIVHCLARMDEANCVVIFEEGEFRLVPERNYKTYVTGGGYHALLCFVKEAIGNIHDNPELLKGGEG